MMVLIKCPECSSDVSDKAENCIKCGFPFKKLSAPADFSETKVKRTRMIFSPPGYLSVILSMIVPGLGEILEGQIVVGIVMLLLAVGIAVPTGGWGYFIMSCISFVHCSFIDIYRCEACRGIISKDAIKCKYCHSEIEHETNIPNHKTIRVLKRLGLGISVALIGVVLLLVLWHFLKVFLVNHYNQIM
jgi:uncharacterized membrane protein YvbJ